MAISIHVVGQPLGGRHRLGEPGLKYCRHLRPVRARLVTRPRRSTRHTARVSRTRVSASLVVALTVMSTVLVSGWYAAAGAAVIADMVRP
jgi:hypothetical protein